jgi:O-antigen/teichoic acid export membrane protein
LKSFLIFTGLYGFTAALNKIIGFIILLFLAKILSPNDFAEYGILIALQQGIVMFGSAGVIETVISRLKPDLDNKQLFSNALISFVSLTLLISLIAMSYLTFSNHGSLKNLYLYTLVILGGIFLSIISFKSQIYRIQQNHIKSIYYSFITSFLSVVFAGFFFKIYKTISSYFLGTIIGVLVPMIFLEYFNKPYFKNRLDISQICNILISSIPYLLLVLLTWLSGSGNNYIIKFIFTSKEIAKYTFLLSLCSIMLMVASALNQVWGPKFFNYVKELTFAAAEKKASFFYFTLNSLLGIFGGGFIIYYHIFLNLIGGNLILYQGMELELSLMFLTYVITTPWWHCYNHFLVSGLGAELLKTAIISSSLALLFTIILMLSFGQIGIFIAVPSQILIRSISIMYYSKKKWNVRFNWYGILIGALFLFIGVILSKVNIIFSTLSFATISVFLLLYLKNTYHLKYKNL